MLLRAGLMLSLLTTGCYSSSGDADDEGNGNGGSQGSAGTTSMSGSAVFVDCTGVEEFLLRGDVDGEVIEITEAPSTGGFAQTSAEPGSYFRLPNASSEPEPDLVNVDLGWEGAIGSGQTAPIEGWVRLPPVGPLAGETICAGPGSEMTIPPRDERDALGEFQFRMLELSRGSDCGQPAMGSLVMCWRN
jgi:hypothetical protein